MTSPKMISAPRHVQSFGRRKLIDQFAQRPGGCKLIVFTVVHGTPSQGVGMADHRRGPWALSFQKVQYTLEMDRMASCAGKSNRFELTLAIHWRKSLALGLAQVSDRDPRASLTALTRAVRFHQRMVA
jgi:hypothetical protein